MSLGQCDRALERFRADCEGGDPAQESPKPQQRDTQTARTNSSQDDPLASIAVILEQLAQQSAAAKASLAKEHARLNEAGLNLQRRAAEAEQR